MLKKISIDITEQVNRLYSVLYENGFASDMRLQASALKSLQEDTNELTEYFKEFKKRFYGFLEEREKTCPVNNHAKDFKASRGQSILLWCTAISTGIAAVSGVVILYITFGC